MEEIKIEQYLDELKPLCGVCALARRCKDHNKVCLAKRQAFNYSRMVYKRRKKRGLI